MAVVADIEAVNRDVIDRRIQNPICLVPVTLIGHVMPLPG